MCHLHQRRPKLTAGARPVQRRPTWAACLLAAALLPLPWPQTGSVAWAASVATVQEPAGPPSAPAAPSPATAVQVNTQQPSKQPPAAGQRPPQNGTRPQSPARPTPPSPAAKPGPRPQPPSGNSRNGSAAAGNPGTSPSPGQQTARPPAGAAVPSPGGPPPALPQTQAAPFSPYVPWPTSKLRVRVIDGRTQQPLEGAEVVLIETEQRLRTGPDGYTPWFDAPVIRNPRYRPMVAELHGQLGVIAYKNGYRDSIHLGIRMHEGVPTETTVWMYKLGPGDTRIEPVLYQVPYHHIWLVELADRFRSSTQPGEGPERP